MHAPAAASPISLTVHFTGATWAACGLAPAPFATLLGRAAYHGTRHWLHAGGAVLGIPDMEAVFVQRHLVIDHLLARAVREEGVRRCAEVGCGLSARGVRFMERFAELGLEYVEADLPDMAARKRALLGENGLLRPGHRVEAVDLLAEAGEMSLEKVFGPDLVPGEPAAVVVEGLVHYFGTQAAMRVFRRLARMLAPHPGSVVLADFMPDLPGHPMRVFLHLGAAAVSLAARSRFHLHFRGAAGVRRALGEAGFREVRVYDPQEFYGVLPIPRCRMETFVKVAAAVV